MLDEKCVTDLADIVSREWERKREGGKDDSSRRRYEIVFEPHVTLQSEKKENSVDDHQLSALNWQVISASYRKILQITLKTAEKSAHCRYCVEYRLIGDTNRSWLYVSLSRLVHLIRFSLPLRQFAIVILLFVLCNASAVHFPVVIDRSLANGFIYERKLNLTRKSEKIYIRCRLSKVLWSINIWYWLFVHM